MASSRGVDWYTEGIARFPVYFPDGNANCRHCQFCTYYEAFNTFKCRLIDAYIERKDLGQRHRLCPVEFQETEF